MCSGIFLDDFLKAYLFGVLGITTCMLCKAGIFGSHHCSYLTIVGGGVEDKWVHVKWFEGEGMLHTLSRYILLVLYTVTL